ncbi:MAG: MFS transporter [Gammaproteobacteria bacterium]|nr:MFS transporter [Gammaproteobacteria bacterium]NIR85520.1 MFS transporter [Gammaproteobacteria bacterium]NIR89779.1 MFS transporter [Gammaproteobacteria bacterium]NIU06655.1 MFS transporter [Gammaproteobacteria bacterium]NIX87928.1 MFS transporter [Gammaproteobacteria bacterium]
MASVASLLLGIGILLIGNGLLHTIVAVRANLEGFANTATGIVMSAYFTGFVLGSFVCPRLIQRFGHVRTFSALAAMTAATAIAYVLLLSAWSWVLLRLVGGLTTVGVFVVIESWLNAQATNETRGRIFGAYMMVSFIALAAGQFLLLVGQTDTFVPFGLATALLALAVVPIALTPVPEPQPVEAPQLGFRRLYAMSPLGFVGAFGSGVANGAFWSLGPVFAQAAGLTEAGIASFMSAAILGGALLQLPIGHLSDRHDRRTVLMQVCFAAMLASLAAFALAERYDSLAGLTACMFVYGGLAFCIYSLSVAHTNDHLTPAEVLGATQGLLLLYGIGAAGGPVAAGLLMDAVGRGSLFGLFAGVWGLLGAFALYRMRARAPVPLAAQEPFVIMEQTSPVALEMHPQVEPAAPEPPATPPRESETAR